RVVEQHRLAAKRWGGGFVADLFARSPREGVGILVAGLDRAGGGGVEAQRRGGQDRVRDDEVERARRIAAAVEQERVRATLREHQIRRASGRGGVEDPVGKVSVEETWGG